MRENTTKIQVMPWLLAKQILSLLLTFIMLGNLSVEAAGLSNFSSAQIRRQVETTIDNLEPTSSPKTPQQFLRDLRDEIEKSLEDQTPTSAIPQKQTEQEHAAAYTQAVERLYKEQIQQFDRKVQENLDGFKQSAQEAYEEQVALLGEAQNEEERRFVEEELSSYRSIIQEETDAYATELAGQREEFLVALNQEKERLMEGMGADYERYSNEFDASMKEAETAQLEFYQELIHQIVISYQQTNDPESKENFVSLVALLSSFEQRKKIFTGDDKKFITEELHKNFLPSNVCAGHMTAEYDDGGEWGILASMGGSPSAAHIYETASNRRPTYQLNDEARCNLAISSLIPFANLDGNGLAVAHFLNSHLEDPLFGQMLLVGAKALTLTNVKGMEGMAKVVDAAMEAEKSKQKKTFWQRMDAFTMEGIFRALFRFKGTFMFHNVSLSARRAAGEPNVWEDVATLLVRKNTPQATAILKKAIDECRLKVTGRYPKEDQFLECKGIYPFLVGVITQKPELTEYLQTTLRANETPGPALDFNGRMVEISPQEAALRREYNNKHDLARNYTKGEMMGNYFYRQFLSDLYPADKQRMDSLIANTALLNPRKTMRAYAASSSDPIYRELENKFNVGTVTATFGMELDLLATIFLIRELGFAVLRVGVLTKNIRRAIQIRKVILEYKHLPMSISKSLKIAHGLQARGIGLSQLHKINKVRNTVAKISQLPKKIVVRLAEGRVPSAPEPRRPRFHHLRKNGAAHRVKLNVEEPPTPMAEAAFAQDVPPANRWTQFRAQAKAAFGKAWNWLNPVVKENIDKNSPVFNLDDLTLTLKDKKGNPIQVTEMHIDNDVLYINGKMAKTYKAYLSLDQLEALSALAKEKGVMHGFEGLWIKLVDKTANPSRWERLRALNEVIETVPLYDVAGVEIMQVGLNVGYKAQRALLESIKQGARLIYQNGKICLEENGALRVLEQFDTISLPKTAINNMIKGKKIDFLQELFNLKDKGQGALNIAQTPAKTFFPLAINFLSYSASATALMLTGEQDFGWSPVKSMAVGIILPYVTSIAAPVLAPVVKRFGARRVMTGSLWLASASLGISMLSGWRGHGQERDENGRMKGAFKVLMWNAALTGLASTGIRASSNVMVKAYETGARTTTVSMAYKSLGGFSMTLIPAVQHFVNKRANLGEEKDWDFSGAYWAILPLSVATALGLRFTMPKMAVPNYVMKGAEFGKPWKFLAKKEVWPYVAGITLMSALEGYAYFKGVSAWERDAITGLLPNQHKSYVKFAASVCTAIPQLTVRAWSPRKAFFGRGMFNSAVMAMTGAGLFMLPSDDWSTGANVAVGVASGLLLGSGTAQVFQYNQKLVGAAVKAAYGEEMVPTAIMLHSAGNFGLALPIIPALVASQRRKNLGEGEVAANRHTTWIPLSGYAVGIGLIALAEHGLAPHLTTLLQAMKTGSRFAFAQSARGARFLFKPMAKGSRYAFPLMGGVAVANESAPAAQLPPPPAEAENNDDTKPSVTLPPPDLRLNPPPSLTQRYSFGLEPDFRLQPAK